MKLKLLIEGGDMKPGPSIAQQLGPIGVNIGKVISDVNQATKEFKGMKVPVELDINEKTKNFTVHTSSPPTSELLKKEFNLEKGSQKISEVKVANASIEDVIKIAKIKHPNMLEKDLKTAVKSVLGTCLSVGIIVENNNAKDIIQEINLGKFSNEISQGLSETSQEKRKNLEEFFKNVKSEEARAAAEKAAAEAAKVAQTGEGVESKEGEAKTVVGTKTPDSASAVKSEKTEAKTVEKSTAKKEKVKK
ncbi:MAG: 50S ribosomal protein L11 [Nanoarchaeota archaeon]